MGFLYVYGFCVVAYASREPKKKRKEENKCQQKKEKEHKNHWLFVGVEFSFFSSWNYIIPFPVIVCLSSTEHARLSYSLCHRKHDSFRYTVCILRLR